MRHKRFCLGRCVHHGGKWENDTDLEITQVILMQLHVFMNFKLNRPIHLNSPRDNWGVEVRDYHV